MEAAFFSLYFTIFGLIIAGATGALEGANAILPILIEAFVGFFIALFAG